MLAAFAFLSAQYEKQLWITLGLVLAFDRVGALDRHIARRETTGAGAALARAVTGSQGPKRWIGSWPEALAAMLRGA